MGLLRSGPQHLDKMLTILLRVSSSASQRNVLHIVADDLRTQLGFYNHSFMHTPNLDLLATQSTVFENAYCQQPICSPSRNSFMSGLTPNHTKAYNFINYFREQRPKTVTMPEYFKNANADTVALGSGKLYHTSNPPNHDEPLSWSPDPTMPVGESQTYYESPWLKCPGCKTPPCNATYGSTFCISESLPEGEDYQTYLHAKGHLEYAAAKKKFFYIGVGFHRPHAPYISRAEDYAHYADNDGAASPPTHPLMDASVPDVAAIINFGIGDQNGTRYSWNPKSEAVPPHVAVEVRKHYYSAVTWVDHLVGLLVADLKRLGVDHNTIIVFHSDHGYFQGESGEWEKKMLFENTARVPLMIFDPATPTAKRSFELAELVDVYPTMVALANLPPPAAGAIDGTDLSSVIRGTSLSERSGTVPIKAAAFTQYPRCPPKGNLSIIQDGACYNNPGTSFSYMGFSVRTQEWRYTEWRRWNPSKTKEVADVIADWSDSGVVATELYEMTNCRASSPDVFDRQLTNVAKDPSHATEIAALQKLIKQHFI